ncbi:MAG: haloacetate dehalogenase [Pseudonocardiales bacterium]|jgi:pimeloyl-ACP methyl ester carboxylesterase|nr:haloacetate dehalogenase [Pseudonocardiales bacterium]
MFDGFEEFDLPTSGGSIRTDLRGFGDSRTPPSAPDHVPHSMREIAGEQVEVMAALGHERFAVVGHDRGARCAYRMALDYPGIVIRLAVLDTVPTGDAFRRADMDFSLGFWVWSFLAAPEPVPERLIAHDPAVLVNHMLDSWSDAADAFPAAVRAEYIKKFNDPDTIHAICEEYRAAAARSRPDTSSRKKPRRRPHTDSSTSSLLADRAAQAECVRSSPDQPDRTPNSGGVVPRAPRPDSFAAASGQLQRAHSPLH